MHQILIYSDSLTWGIIPDTRARLPFDERWPGVLENKLNASGPRIRVIEDCLNGRRTAWDDPFKRGRNGLEGLAQRIEINSPLSLVILMLGTNDFQFCQSYETKRIAEASPRFKARIAGALFVLGLLSAVFGEFFVRRLEIAADLIALSSMIAVTLLLYGVFKPVIRGLPMLAASFNLVGLI